jgi:signal transduction histidine kinase/CheY-like chemotaxis protein
LFEALPGLYLILTPQLDIVAVSDSYLRATMTTREQILGRGIFEIFPDNPADPAATGVSNLRASLLRVIATGRADVMAVQRYDVRRPEDPQGPFEHRYWSPLNSPLLNASGQVDFIAHRVEDVTEFVQLQQARNNWREQTAALENRAAQMQSEVYLRSQEVAESNRRLRAANDQLERLYQQIGHLMQRAGDELHAAGNPAPVPPELGPEDMLARIEQLMTEHTELEDQLRQSQKMEAVGQLAGGVAHDFNNLLTVITGQSVLLQQELPGHNALSKLKEIEAAAHRAATLTGQLLAFSRKQMVQPRVLSVNSVVGGVEEMLRRLIGDQITVLCVSGSGLGMVKVDPVQLEMVIMNLAVNARDAMPDGGRLTIETGSAELRDAQVLSLKAGPYVTIRVSDTGHGIDAATAARVFEPFFTTKPAGKGTGLGLSTARGIAEQSGGTLTVESTPDKGTTFCVYLPVYSGAVVAEPENVQSVPPGAASPEAGGCVLVVEDHPPLRELIHEILGDAGYRVIAATNGAEALHLAASNPVDVVLTDIMMPGMTGLALIQQLRTQSRHPRVVFMSGHDQGLLKAHGEGALFLQKPFTPKALKAAIASALETQREQQTAV